MTSKTIITCDACGEPITGRFFVLALADTRIGQALISTLSAGKDLHPGCLGAYGARHGEATEARPS